MIAVSSRPCYNFCTIFCTTHPATASLAELLQNAPEDPDFDLESWTQQWQAIEAEMKALDRTDDIAEGRG